MNIGNNILEHVSIDAVEKVNVSFSNRIFSKGTSKGCQEKWLKDNLYIKLNSRGRREDISEVLVSHFLEYTNISNFVRYYPCIVVEEGIERGLGCYSKSFLNGDESCYSFAKILRSEGLRIEDTSYKDIISTFEKIGYNVKEYLDSCLCLDAIICNEDRHLNNLAMIGTGDLLRPAPIFDNGLSCLCDLYEYPLEESDLYLMYKVRPKTFGGTFKDQIINNGVKPIKVNKERFLENTVVKTEIEERALNIIKYNLFRLEGVAWQEF